jgi:hypothetical protein
MSFDDYVKFFYITTINYYKEEFKTSLISDEPLLGGIGLIRFSLTKAFTEPVIITVD